MKSVRLCVFSGDNGMNSKESVKNHTKLRQSLVLTLVLFVMLTVYWRELHFVTDEGDVFELGKAIAWGQLLYRDVLSQHMPFMYYISAVLFLLGADSYVKMRLAFYLLMAAAWGGMYYRYSDRFGKKQMVLYPVLYTVMLSHIYLGHSILSEQMQGIGYVLLLLELLQFAQTRRITVGTGITVSIAVLLTFGTAFVSAFAVAFVLCTVMGMEIVEHIRQKTGFRKAICAIFRKYWLLFVIVLAPMAAIAGFYLATGTWDDFIGWSYRINREVYPKYNSGGYGGNIISGIYHGLPELLRYLTKPELTVSGVACLMLLFLAILFFLLLWRKHRDPVLELGVFAFLVGTATRGVFEFHGLGAVAVLCMMASVSLCELLPKLRESNWRATALIVCGLVFVSSYVELVPGLARISLGKDQPVGSLNWAVETLTQKGERIGNATLHVDVLFEAHTLTVPMGASTPWTWEWQGLENLAAIAPNPPRVFLYNEANDVWGSVVADYAPELDAFLKENYTAFPEYDLRELYVRNDYYPEAQQILAAAGMPALYVQQQGNTLELTFRPTAAYTAVQFPVWTFDGGQDDLHYYDARQQSDGSWTATVDLYNHNEPGNYVIHALADSGAGFGFVKEYSYIVPELPASENKEA